MAAIPACCIKALRSAWPSSLITNPQVRISLIKALTLANAELPVMGLGFGSMLLPVAVASSTLICNSVILPDVSTAMPFLPRTLRVPSMISCKEIMLSSKPSSSAVIVPPINEFDRTASTPSTSGLPPEVSAKVAIADEKAA